MRLAVEEVKKNHEMIMDMYKAGRTPEEIGDAIGYTTMSVNNILRPWREKIQKEKEDTR